MDLTVLSGLPMSLDDETGILRLPVSAVVEETRARLLDELTGVYLDQTACRGKDAAYYMYNGIFLQSDAAALADLPVRYELTLLPDRRIGREYLKTHGHIHTREPRSGIDYPEICEVLAGMAHFFFQTLQSSGPSAGQAFYVEVRAGEKIVIPPGYEHLTINPGPGPLLFSDVVARGMGGIYDGLRAARGGAYLEVEENGKPAFIPNPAYESVPPLRKARPREFSALGLPVDRPLYSAFLETRGAGWNFLWEPECFKDLFAGLDDLFQF